MAAKICTHCESRAGIPHMIQVSRTVNPTTNDETIEWKCPFCGHEETLITSYQATGGNYNSGIGYAMTQNSGPSNP